MHTSSGVRALHIEDQLLEVFNGVDVVVWGWRNQTNASGCVTCARNPGVNLVIRELTTFTRLRALSHLDLDVISVSEIHAGDTETTRSNLLDGRTTSGVKKTGNVFTTLTSVALGANRVHRNRECLVSLR